MMMVVMRMGREERESEKRSERNFKETGGRERDGRGLEEEEEEDGGMHRLFW